MKGTYSNLWWRLPSSGSNPVLSFCALYEPYNDKGVIFMLEQLKQEANKTYTENGAITYSSTGSHCLDLFATIGALRNAEQWEIMQRFLTAYTENPDLAMKILFFGRDVRGGLGERRVFQILLQWLAAHHPQSVEKNIPYIAEYGRYDDLLVLLDTPCEGAAMEQIKTQFEQDCTALKQGQSVSLLAKWLPSVNASSPATIAKAKRVARFLSLKDSAYRKKLSALREKIAILENYLRLKEYTFDYSKQPSKAMFKYRKAFLRNDTERYNQFMNRVKEGKETIHTGTLAPYEIVQPIITTIPLSEEEKKAIDVTWNAQENFAGDENALVVVDGSGSMYGTMYGGSGIFPASVALSLGIYFAERNTGKFHNHFITFSEKPRLVKIKGTTIYDKLQYCMQYNEVANTNLRKVFDLILQTAIKYKIPQEEMPKRLYIISDMEFDYCVEDGSLTNFQYAQKSFAQFGYQLPDVIFWNVDSRNQQQPVEINDVGVALVSGCSPRIFSMLQSDTLSPYAYMMDVIGSPRYAQIVA